MGQSGFPAAGKPGKPEQGTSVAVEAVTVGLLDAPVLLPQGASVPTLRRENRT